MMISIATTTIKIKKLKPEAIIPSKRNGDLGFDLTATSENIVLDEKGTFGYIEYGTDLAVEIPRGFGGFIFPRSSISNTGLLLSNAVGVIDPTYRGEIKCRFKHISRTNKYKVGDRIAQLVILPVPEMGLEETDELTKTERNEQGFGSTGT